MNKLILKSKIEGIINLIKDYTGKSPIVPIIDKMIEELDNQHWDYLIYACDEIKKWLKKNINKILTNDFVFNKDEFKLMDNNIDEIIDLINQYNKTSSNTITEAKDSSDKNLENIFNRFYNIALQLEERHNNRNSLKINDEYDVQDLLHSLLTLYYEDIRVEEWTPSYAGKSSRQDFLLKDENIVIETKMTRADHDEKKLGDELIIDIDRYKLHPNCKILYLFIYDPKHYIKNKVGFENDLTKNTDGIIVKTFIRPKI